MATNHNIDKLFSERLENLSYTPSADANKLFEQKLKAKANNSSYYWWSGVAAAAILVLFIWNWHSPKIDSNHSNYISGIVDHPTYMENKQLPEYKITKTSIIESKTIQTKHSFATINTSDVKEAKQRQSSPNEIFIVEKIYTIATISAPNIAITDIPKEVPNAIQKLEKSAGSSSVKITYIASKPKEETPSSKFGQIFAMAQKVSDSHPLADIREAKDNLLSRN